MKVRQSLWALIPVAIYATVYFIMVVVITAERGGWEDFYGFATRLPLWIPVTLIMPLTFGIATVLRLWHNHSFVNRRKNEAEIFLGHFEGKDTKEILFEMGKARAKIQPYGDLIIPMLVIRKILFFTESDMSVEDASGLYLSGYLSVIDG